jgi:S-DNA-T family DNA segregation ATPase FtsK/SpoIIIE
MAVKKTSSSAGKKTGKKAAPVAPAIKKTGAKKAAASSKPSAKLSKRLKKLRPPSIGGDVKARGRLRPVRTGISLDRKLDMLGVFLAVVGFLTILAMLSQTNSTLTGGWVNLIARLFGLGMFIFPLALVIVGGWLVLRNFERVPQFSAERILGLTLLYVNLLVWMHFLAADSTGKGLLDLADAGQGGGYTGAFILQALQAALGVIGTLTVLAAWFLMALALTLDKTILAMFGWIPPLILRIQDWIIDLKDARQERLSQRQPSPQMPNVEHDLMQPQTATAPPASAIMHNLPVGIPIEAQLTSRPYILPLLAEILDAGVDVSHDDDVDRQRARVIEETLSSFGAPARVVEINRGPTITQFGVEPDFVESRTGRMRVRVGKIAALADDLALALSARTIRIQAPVPGKGFIGIEVPNDEITMVALRDVMESEAFKRLRSPLRFALGQNVAGNAVAADLAAMPHLLVAGATGSGKSVCVNALICCLLANNTPDDLRLLMVDPKRVELTGYNGIPHLLAPVVVDLERVVGALQWVTREMDLRYRKLAEAGCRNIQDYNNKQLARNEKKLFHLVVIIDELADLMMLAPDETERTITRLAQLARATGIHLVIATQRPSVDVVTGLIKANFPARVAFAVASGVDSRVILDQPGAERLLGRGDMLFQAPDAPAPVRLQGVYVSDNEILRLVGYWHGFASTSPSTPTAAGGIVDAPPANLPLKQIPMWDEMRAEEDRDPLLYEAIDEIRRQGRASVSMLQRKMRIGYTRASRLIEAIEEQGIIGPPEPGTGTRQVLDYGQAAPPVGEE